MLQFNKINEVYIQILTPLKRKCDNIASIRTRWCKKICILGFTRFFSSEGSVVSTELLDSTLTKYEHLIPNTYLLTIISKIEIDWWAHLLRIREVQDSSLGLETAYPK